MKKRKNDIVTLNVGGTLFTSSVSTLCNSSSYFQRCLSEEWREGDSHAEEAIVIDQDPLLFSVLLSYMRLGSIEAEALTTPVLLLAVFFGMDELLEAVRAVAIRSKFEESNLSLFSAAQAALLVNESDVEKRFASLTICHPDFVSFDENRGIDPDFLVYVEVQNEEGTVEIPTNTLTFIDALNFLSKSGYIRYESEKFEPKQGYSTCLVRMWFSKLVKVGPMGSNFDSGSSIFRSATTTIRESYTGTPVNYPREYCYIIQNDDNGDELSQALFNILEADVGYDEKQIEFSGPSELLDRIRIGKSRSVILWNVDSKIKKYNWLQNQGYKTPENELAKAFSEAIKIFNPKTGHNSIVSVWSRESR